jgi:hypothetical protein
VFRRFDDYLDRELGPAEMELVREHLEYCARCARELEFEDSVLRQVRAKIQRLPVPADLLDRIARAIAAADDESPGR